MNRQLETTAGSLRLSIGSTPRSTSERLARMAEDILASDLTLNCALMTREECSTLITATSEEPNCEAKPAAEMGRQLLGFFRKVEFEDSHSFAVALAGLFCRYPEGIGRKVCDPVCGLPGRLRFPPSLAEVREELERHMAKRRAIAYRARWMIEEHARRDEEAERERERSDPAEMERRRRIVEELSRAAEAAAMPKGET